MSRPAVTKKKTFDSTPTKARERPQRSGKLSLPFLGRDSLFIVSSAKETIVILR